MPKAAPPLDDATIADLLKHANAFLKAERAKVSLIRAGDMLYFRGTFPPKPGSKKPLPHQQKIAARLPVSRQGIKKARSEAILIGAKLVSGDFSWDEFNYRTKAAQLRTSTWIRKFEDDYRATHQLRDRTWNENWLKWFKQLPQQGKLTPEALVKLALSKKPNSSSRRLCCQRLQALANFAGVEVDLLQYQGNYGRSKVEARELPSDEAISGWREAIPNARWQYLYGLIAAYGLRPHEAFFSEIKSDHSLVVSVGKTGQRIAKPFYPEWVDLWHLEKPNLPLIDAERSYHKGNLGKKISNQFRDKYKMPFKVYDLRHAFAIRTHVSFGLPESVCAKLMGHSVEEHMRTYQKWLDGARTDAAIERALTRSDRPMPPSTNPL